MFSASSLLFSVLILFQAVLINCSKVGTIYSNGLVLTNENDSILSSSFKQPTVIFQFPHFSVDNTVDDPKYPFLSNLLRNRLSSYSEISKPKSFWKSIKQELKANASDLNIKVLKFKKLPDSPESIFEKIDVADKDFLVIKFKGKEYDLLQLNNVLEVIMNHLDNVLPSKKNIILASFLNSKSDFFQGEIVGINDVDVDHEEVSFNINKNHQKGLRARKEKSNKDKESDDEEDKDILSKIWTEGLLMCLLVSLLLIGVLVVAITWIASLDISYGALEKSTNPLKKSN